MAISNEDRQALLQDKYDGNNKADISADVERLAAGEPLAYVIGWIPFLGLKIQLDSRPLIPRPETEWWTEKLVDHLKARFGSGANAKPFTFLDLCAGSGAIGLTILKEFPTAQVWFGELMPEHAEQIEQNISVNNLDSTRARILQGNLFEPVPRPLPFDVIATNPPYIPEGRELAEGVQKYEPSEALFAGSDGLSLIKRIVEDVRTYLVPDGELWMECDIENIEEAKRLAQAAGLRATIHEDQYGRQRYIVAHLT